MVSQEEQEMEYEVPSIVETKLTGYVGSAFRTVRGVEYAVRFTNQAGELTGTPSRAGKPSDWCKITRKMADSGFRFFARGV
jgi:hypothetical protein